jgi:hypothetical protein
MIPRFADLRKCPAHSKLLLKIFDLLDQLCMGQVGQDVLSLNG